MHVLLVSHYSPPHMGGIEFVIGQLWNRLASRGFHVTILACDTGIPSGVHRQGGKTRIGLPAMNILEDYSIPFPIFNPLPLRQALRETLATVDVVHVHGMLYMSSVLAAWMAHRKGVPVILTEHVGKVPFRQVLLDSIQEVAFHTFGRLTCRHSDCVTVLNQRVEAEIKPFVRRGTPITRVSNGVDTALFHPVSAEKRQTLRRKWDFDGPVALFVGRFVRKKGIDLLLQAAGGGFDLALCGKGRKRFDHPHVRVIGLVDQEILAEMYQAADVLVLPSEGEGFPLVVQEAMASGLPVIVTDDDVNREVLNEDVAVFTERSGPAVREKILSLISDPQRCRRLGKAAHRWAVAHFDWEKTIDEYISLYRRLGVNDG